MKPHDFLNNAHAAERQAEKQLLAVLGRVPFLRARLANSPRTSDGGYDLLAEVRVGDGEPWTLVCEVKSNSRPSVAHMAVVTLHSILHRWPQRGYGILITPFVSERTAAICQEYDVGYLDFAGNCRLCFDHVFIETTGRKADQPSPKKVWPALFGTKSARVLRRLLREPHRAWKVQELAQEAGVSIGLVSNVRGALLEQEWAVSGDDGLRLNRPDDMLDAWRVAYRPLHEERQGYHTILHGTALTDAIRTALAEAGNSAHAVLAGNAAAQWLAPYATGGAQRFYADDVGAAALIRHLRLKPAPRGANVFIDRPKDEGIFLDAVEGSPGLWCTSPVQTFLDLSAADDRSAEAAQHLRTEVLTPLFRKGT